MTPNEAMVWLQVGSGIVQIGKALVSDIRGAVRHDPAADLAVLDRLDADYARRIERREADGS